MTEIVFATHNENKVKEINTLADAGWKIISLSEIGFNEDIPEPYDTLEENARQKARNIFQKTGKNCFGEDTGLEVEALRGAPGVRSARFAGSQRNNEDNIALLLQKMEGRESRSARFRTIISFFYKGEEHRFEGICNGRITEEKKGEKGFGYDPVFIPDGADKTFAEMTMEEKNRYSHRAKAFQKFMLFLEKLK